jgi:hypothetical protein
MKFDKNNLCYYIDENIGGNFVKLFANEKQGITVSNSFPAKHFVEVNKKIEPDIVNGKELISFSEKMRQKNVPF